MIVFVFVREEGLQTEVNVWRRWQWMNFVSVCHHFLLATSSYLVTVMGDDDEYLYLYLYLYKLEGGFRSHDQHPPHPIYIMNFLVAT